MAAALGFCFSRLQKRILASTRNQNFQSYSRNNGMIISAQRTTLYYIVLCIYSVLLWFKISNLRETSAKKTFLAANSTFVRTDVGTLEAFAIKRLTWTIRSSIMYEMLIAFTWTHIYAIFFDLSEFAVTTKVWYNMYKRSKAKSRVWYIYIYNIKYIYIYIDRYIDNYLYIYIHYFFWLVMICQYWKLKNQGNANQIARRLSQLKVIFSKR